MSLTRYEASDDGFISKVGSVYTLYDYGSLFPGVYHIEIFFDSDGDERRGFKRFIMDMGGVTITSAILYWYLSEISTSGGCTKSCKLEQINDYEILEATSADFAITSKHNYGNVMAYNATHPAWVSQDVTAEMEASKADPYVAFRWSVESQPASGGIHYYVCAYELTVTKAYLVLTYTTGWQHQINGVAPAGVEKINAVARTTGIDEVNSS